MAGGTAEEDSQVQSALLLDYASLLEALPDPVVAADSSNRIVYGNRAVGLLLNWPIGELVGQPLTVIIPPNYRNRHQAAFERFVRTGQPTILHHPIGVPALTRSGETVDIELTIAATTLAGNLLLIASLRDLRGRVDAVTIAAPGEDVRRVQELEETIRARDEFLASVSHDLKNPLAVIKARAQILQRRAQKIEGDMGQRLADGLGAIDASATRMTRLINDLTDLVNLRAGRPLMLNREQVDLALLTRAVAREQQTALGRTITVEVDTPSLPASVDVTRMERVLVNLLSNAAKYSPDGGDITLRLSQEGEAGSDVAVLSVTDRGIGIPEDEIPRIFDRFYRASNIGGVAGTGVGLASAAQIVQQHGGSIDVASGEGRGSTFTVRIPV